MKKLIVGSLLLIASLNVCYAASTVIRSNTANPVQCNHWGWVHNNVQTVWNNACTPLEVKSHDGSKVYAVATTENTCEGNRFAIYTYNEGDDAIRFSNCY